MHSSEEHVKMSILHCSLPGRVGSHIPSNYESVHLCLCIDLSTIICSLKIFLEIYHLRRNRSKKSHHNGP
uniref:Uncharacterized protein n=1 Tax=Pararge aegeria TaxID=116150 RepID=S4NTJ8_9NEOP